MDSKHKTVIQRAVDKAGSEKALAKAVGVSRSAIAQWKLQNRIPAERCRAVEKITGIPRYELRPDIYGDEP